MTKNDLILVTGATGKQGGSTLRHLARQGGFRLRALTRNPGSDAAQALARSGVEVVQGDLDDLPSLERALAGAWGVYSVQNTWEAGVEKEEQQSLRLAMAARELGVQHFVYASVGSAHRATGIPHFENKFRVEQKVKSLGFPSYAILRPVFFMENLLSPWFLHGDALHSALKPTTRVQMIAADDIGRFAAQAFLDAQRHRNAEVDIAGDSATLVEAAEAVSTIVGRKVTYVPIPMAKVREGSADFALMLEWFERVGYSADIASLERTWKVRPLTLREWAASQRKP